jgi:hypothetical protein
MKLLEFFGKPIEIHQDKNDSRKPGEDPKLNREEEDQLANDILEYILNNDELHKKQFLPVARKLHKNPTTHHKPDVWLALVNKGCMEFYKERDMSGDPIDLFNKEFRSDLCKKFSDHNKHILMGEYNLGR